MFEDYFAFLPAVPLCLHVKWYRAARSVSLVSFHSQDPRLEAVTLEHLEPGWGYAYILGIFQSYHGL